jgi:hypothetical protein
MYQNRDNKEEEAITQLHFDKERQLQEIEKGISILFLIFHLLSLRATNSST